MEKIQKKVYYQGLLNRSFDFFKKSNDDPDMVAKFLNQIKFYYGNIAICELILDNDIVLAKINFYKSVRVIELIFENWKGLSSFPSSGIPAFSSIMYLDGSYLILCDNLAKFTHFFKTIEYIEGSPGIGREGYFYHLTSAFKAFALKDFEKSVEHINEARKPSSMKYAERTIGYENVLLGIILKNIELIENGIDLNLKYHESHKKNALFPEFCLESTAMVKLAYMHGFEVKNQSAYIHQDITIHNQTIVYEDIEEVYNALKHKKPWWKIF